jgi:hypothetical protein
MSGFAQSVRFRTPERPYSSCEMHKRLSGVIDKLHLIGEMVRKSNAAQTGSGRVILHRTAFAPLQILLGAVSAGVLFYLPRIVTLGASLHSSGASAFGLRAEACRPKRRHELEIGPVLQPKCAIGASLHWWQVEQEEYPRADSNH